MIASMHNTLFETCTKVPTELCTGEILYTPYKVYLYLSSSADTRCLILFYAICAPGLSQRVYQDAKIAHVFVLWANLEIKSA